MKIEYLKSGKVVDLSSARRDRKFKAIAQIETYWDALRNGRLMPARSEVDPRGFADSLAYAFVLERIAPGLARIRLAGQHLNEILGMEVRGMPISAFFLPEARAEIHEALENVFESPARVNLTLRTKPGMFVAASEAQIVLLPLRDETGAVTRVLGALQVEGKLGRAPTRFEVRGMEASPLLSDTSFPQRLSDQLDANVPDAEPADAPNTARPTRSWEFKRPLHEVFDVERVDLSPDASDGPTEGRKTGTDGSASAADKRGAHIPGFAEHAEGFEKRPKAPTKPGQHLTLIKND
ncbi:PAS domain-containing protein [Aliiroseovarius marinus]|uniref:PAS domain-containing protein n=1 Tax=Aliiroseovarius marinus TaxID=2500159 RepID=UPI003D7E70BB